MVPNYKFAEQSVTNHTKRLNRRIRWLIGLEYKTTIDQLKQIRDQITEIIKQEQDYAKTDHSPYYIRVDSFSDSSINMLVQVFTTTNDWS